jgi:Mg2+ and Co2+ transporter CorA
MRNPEGRLAHATGRQGTPSLTAHDLRRSLMPEASKESRTGGLGGLLGWRRANHDGHQETETDVVPKPNEPENTEPETAKRETTEMIDQILEPLKPVQDQLSELAKRLEPLARVRPLTEAFGPLRVFKDKLASAVEPIRNLEREFEQLADVFEPIRLIRDELVDITRAFAGKLTELTQTLAPLGKLREELMALTAALEPATELLDDFTKLSVVIATTAHEPAANSPEMSDAQLT